jgi:hypothetical protein
MMSKKALSDGHGGLPSEPPLDQLRIPFVHKARLMHDGATEEAFVVDVGLRGVFVERADPLPVGKAVDLQMGLPGNEIPLRARCRVAWFHGPASPLHAKSLPSGLGLEFQDLSVVDQERVKDLLEGYCSQNPQARRFLRHWPESTRTDDPLLDDTGE